MQFDEARAALPVEGGDGDSFTFTCPSCFGNATCYRGLDDEAVVECSGACKPEEILGDAKTERERNLGTGTGNGESGTSNDEPGRDRRGDTESRIEGGGHTAGSGTNGSVPQAAYTNGVARHPDLFQWKSQVYDLARHAVERLIKAEPATKDFVASMDTETFVETVNKVRNIPDMWLTHDPAGLSETEISEEVWTIAQAVQKNYAPAMVEQTKSENAVVIPWEGFSAAIAANEEYLKRTPVVDKLCYSSAISMITGGKHAGKSTLARWMAICIVKGWPFLEREVIQGPVCYIASDDETMVARQELLRLGWSGDDPLKFLAVGNSGVDDKVKFLEYLARDIKDFRSRLVILDMLFDFVDVKDEISYAGTREALGRIQRVASETEAHIVTIHHAPKHAQGGDASIAALGSQGIAARVSPIILVRRFGPGVHSVVSTDVRDPRGKAILESRLSRKEDGSVVLGGAWKSYMLAEAYAPRVLDYLGGEEGSEATASDIVQALDMQYEVVRACLNSLYKGGFLRREGTGKKGSPFRYSVINKDTF